MTGGNQPQRARIVHCKREAHDVYIGRGRGSIWGNPFVIGEHGNRDEVIQRFAEWLPTQPKLMDQVHELHGKTLGCFCAPQRCHGDVLAEFAEKAFALKHGITIEHQPAQAQPAPAGQLALDF